MKEGSETSVTALEYLKRPYARMVVPEPDGSYRAEIQEFPGCIALAPSAAEALTMLDEVAAEWIDAALSKGQRIPEPTEDSGYSGKLVLRLAKSLHRKAAYAANREGVSLNQFIVSALAEQIGASNAVSGWTAVNLVHVPPVYGSGPTFLGTATTSGFVGQQLTAGMEAWAGPRAGFKRGEHARS